VTHQVEEAVYLGQKIVILTASPGKVRQVVDNSLFDAGIVRNGGNFACQCAAIRKIIQEAWQK
jgi:NitT/TauT family transport system ATP-binding protein